MTVEESKKHKNKPQVNDFLDKYARERETLFACVLDDVELEAELMPYSHSTGPWCRA